MGKSQKGGLFFKFATREDKKNVRKAKKKGSAATWWLAKKLYEKEQKHKRQKGGKFSKRKKKMKQKGGIFQHLQPWKKASNRRQLRYSRKENGQIIRDRHPEFFKNNIDKFRSGKSDYEWYKMPKNKKFKDLSEHYATTDWTWIDVV